MKVSWLGWLGWPWLGWLGWLAPRSMNISTSASSPAISRILARTRAFSAASCARIRCCRGLRAGAASSSFRNWKVKEVL